MPFDQRSRFLTGTGKKTKNLTKTEQRLQAILILMRRLEGGATMTHRQLAQEFGLHEDTVRARLHLAMKDPAILEIREYFVRDLLPKAMEVVRDALEGPDKKLAFQAARMVVDGLDVLAPPPAPPQLEAGPNGQPLLEETLEVWRVKAVSRPQQLTEPTVEVPPDVQVEVLALPEVNDEPKE